MLLLELYAQSVDTTAVYSIYLTIVISMSMSAVWIFSNPSFIDSYISQIKLKSSEYEAAFKNKADLITRFHLRILKRIKIKIDPGEDDSHFSPLVNY